MFFGYSDLTTILNAIYTKAGKTSVLYQTMNLVGSEAEMQQKRFQKSILQGQDDLYRFRYSFIQGNELRGTVIGGNIRCFLKLAGTPYFPNTEGKVLLLEAMSGGVAKIATYLCQLNQIGVFKDVSGIILGSFTMLGENPFELLQQYISSDLPVVQTPDVGHGQDANAVKIGGYIDLCNGSWSKISQGELCDDPVRMRTYTKTSGSNYDYYTYGPWSEVKNVKTE